MKTANFAAAFAAAACVVSGLVAQTVAQPATQTSAQTSNPAAAAAYLDGRMDWWMAWPSAARDHGTFCVSCHTAAPYALARPALRTALGNQTPTATEQKFVDNVTKRVKMWNEVLPFYPDEKNGVPKTAESRGTEAILNALVLTSFKSPDARLALDNMWALQLKTGDAKGAWSWLQFHNAPWEGDSQFYGATLAAIAVGAAPGNYRDTPEIQDGMKMLRDYLTREADAQKLIDRMMLLWASAKIPNLLTPAQRKAIVDAALAKQRADGGFSMSDFVEGWKRKDSTPLEASSDGYATGVVVLALKQSGTPAGQPQLKRAVDWLNQNQDRNEGRWRAYSLNKKRDLATDVGKFMSDAATAYAVLALQSSN